MTSRPRRVPPPPPPGFGDEEYYKLYGEPEEYQKYRRDLETKLQRKDSGSPPQHEEYYVYRRFKSHEESYDYYYGPRQREGSPSKQGRKRRIAPPPPPGFEDDPPSPPPNKKRIAPPPPTDFSSEGDSGDEGPQVFKNFRVTIKNETDGTPSLSESEGERRGRGKGKKKRKRKKEREREKRRRLEKKLAKREQELKLLSKKRNLSGGKEGEEAQASAVPGEGVVEKPRKSVKDRLGDKKVVVKKEKLSPVRISSAERGRREELLRRAEVRRQNQEKSPIPYQGKRKSRTPDRRRRRSNSSQSRNKKRGKRSRSRSKRRGGRSRSRSRNRNVSGRSRRSSSRRRNTGRRSRSPLRRGPVKLNKKKRKRRRRDRERDRARRRGGMGIRDLENMKEENEEMRAKLADRLKKKSQKPVGGSLEDRLAEMAGIGGLKADPGRERRSGSSSSESEGYDSESGSDSDGKGRRGKEKVIKKEQLSDKTVGGKMRSDKVTVDLKDSTVKTPDKWQHDKFEEGEARDTPEKESDVTSFGKHWTKIRSERSKERDRKKSRSRSRSRRSRSGTGSRSRTRSRTRRKKRRGKFSRSRSGSSSESSRSRSKSYSSRSRSSTRSPPNKKPKDKAPSAPADKPAGEVEGSEKEGVDLGLSGALTADANSFNGAVIKYAEPAEARKPKKKWRLYVFKGNEELPILYIHRQSAYLLGRDRKIADIPLDHPSCSKQHSALQYRLVPYTRPDQTQGRRVQLYIMDLASANGTFVNNNKIEPQKYVQLMEKDVLKFGFSSREYVLLHDQSKEEEEDMGVD